MSFEKDLLRVLRDIEKDLHVIAKYVRTPKVSIDNSESEDED